MSEIDEIFASRPTQSNVPTLADNNIMNKKVKRKKRKRDAQPVSTTTKAEIILDPSVSIPTGKRVKLSKPSTGPKSSVSAFVDSRGSQSRRKTEEGWTIYKEDELGIRNEGGDTPLCPFDCDCCF